jgi:hypothetical protein
MSQYSLTVKLPCMDVIERASITKITSTLWGVSIWFGPDTSQDDACDEVLP